MHVPHQCAPLRVVVEAHLQQPVQAVQAVQAGRRCRRCRVGGAPPLPSPQRQRLTAPAQKRLQLASGPSPASPRCGMHPSPTHSRCCEPCMPCTPCAPCKPCSRRRRRRRAAHGPTAAWLASCCLLSCCESLWSRPHNGPHECPSGVGSRICAGKKRVSTGCIRSTDRLSAIRVQARVQARALAVRSYEIPRRRANAWVCAGGVARTSRPAWKQLRH